MKHHTLTQRDERRIDRNDETHAYKTARQASRNDDKTMITMKNENDWRQTKGKKTTRVAPNVHHRRLDDKLNQNTKSRLVRGITAKKKNTKTALQNQKTIYSIKKNHKHVRKIARYARSHSRLLTSDLGQRKTRCASRTYKRTASMNERSSKSRSHLSTKVNSFE